MRVLLLLLVPLLLQDPAAKGFRRPLSIRNRDDIPLPAGLQVGVARPERVIDRVEVLHKGRKIPCWSHADKIWFRLAVPIAGREVDDGYEVRYGGERPAYAPQDVFEFFEEAGEKGPDPKRWDADPLLKFEPDSWGWAVTRLNERRTESDPASLIGRHAPLPAEFVLEADLRWEIPEKADFSFAMRIEIDEEVKADDSVRKRCAELVAKLGDDDLEVRELASQELIKVGRAAVPQLVQACRSSDAQVRARAESIIAAIHKASPPQLLRVGIRAEPGVRPTLLLHQGKGRYEVKGRLATAGKASVYIERTEGGGTYIEWPGAARTTRGEKIPGTVGRIRFDYWGEPEGFKGVVWISRVKVRRYVDLDPTEAWGDEVEIR